MNVSKIRIGLAAVGLILMAGFTIILYQIMERAPAAQTSVPGDVASSEYQEITASGPEKHRTGSEAGEVIDQPEQAHADQSVTIDYTVDIVDEAQRQLLPEAREFELDPVLLKDITERKKPMEGLFESVLEAEQEDGKVALRYTLTNISGEDLEMYHSSGQQYDYWIANAGGEEIYRWSIDKSFIQVIMDVVLKDGEQLVFTDEWSLLTNAGERVPPGVYTITFQAMLSPKSGTINQDELIGGTTVEVR